MPTLDLPQMAARHKLSLALGVVVAALLVAAGQSSASFLGADNLLVVLRTASITGIAAIGMSFMTISGNLFALSTGAVSALLSVIFAMLLRAGVDLFTSCALLAFLAVALGAAQGVTLALIRNPIIVTIAYGAVFVGAAAFISGNGNIRVHNPMAEWFGVWRPLGVPVQSWVFVLWAVAGHFILRKTRAGRRMVLCGTNRLTAEATGLAVEGAAMTAMALLGLSCAIIAIFSVSQFSQAKADMFGGLDIDCIASVLVGGIALQGGRGSPIQAAFGAILIALLQNYMLLMSVSTGIRLAVVGGMVAAATTIFQLLQARAR